MSLEDIFKSAFAEEEKEEKKEEVKKTPKEVIQQPAQPAPAKVETPVEVEEEEAVEFEEKEQPSEALTAGPTPTITPPTTPASTASILMPEVVAAKPEVKEAKPVVTIPERFEVAEEQAPGKEVYMIYGLKGHGKTALAMSFPGKISVISFDHKAAPVKARMYKNDPRIKVYDGLKYMDFSSPEAEVKSSDVSFRYIRAILDKIAREDKPDWVVIDGSDVLQTICEMRMRYNNNLLPFQGISNRNLWKERRMYIRQIHNEALNAAKRGLIYTAYTDSREIVVDGDFVVKEEVPKWIDAIMLETDVVIKVEAATEKTGRRFLAFVESSKGSLPTGKKVDITGDPSVLWR